MSVRTAPFLDAPQLQRYGLPELVFGASPAVATDFTQTVTGAYYARLVAVFCRLVTDANVASREVVLEYRDQGGNRFAVMGAPTTVAATTTIDYSFTAYQGQADWPADSTIMVPLAPILLAPTNDFRLHVVSVQAADQLSRVRFVWERFYSDVRVPGREPADF